MPQDHDNESRLWLLERWAARLGESLAGMTGEPAEVRPENTPAQPEGLLWSQQIQGLEGPAWWVAAPEPVWQAAGARILELAGLTETAAEDRRSTFLEVLSQSLSALAQDVGGRLGRELTPAQGAEPVELPASLVWLSATVQLAGAADLPRVAIAFSDILLAQIQPQPVAAAAAACASASGNSLHAAPAPPTGRTLDLLMEVELPVSVSFGRNQMRLKELVKLNTGSIVELNRSVTEPVEVIVNNCVIARGEVVVVEGNYGVRIKQIISRQERLRSLF